jgi:hypothetical protein
MVMSQDAGDVSFYLRDSFNLFARFCKVELVTQSLAAAVIG